MRASPEVAVLQRHYRLLELVLGGLSHGSEQEVHLLVEVLQLPPDDGKCDARCAEAHPVGDRRQYEVEPGLQKRTSIKLESALNRELCRIWPLWAIPAAVGPSQHPTVGITHF